MLFELLFFLYDLASSILQINRTRSKNEEILTLKIQNLSSQLLFIRRYAIFFIVPKINRNRNREQKKKVSYLELIAFGRPEGVEHFFSPFLF